MMSVNQSKWLCPGRPNSFGSQTDREGVWEEVARLRKLKAKIKKNQALLQVSLTVNETNANTLIYKHPSLVTLET